MSRKGSSICFLPQHQRQRKKFLLNLLTPTWTWKCTRCIMQMSYLYSSAFPFKKLCILNFCKLAQQAETIQKNVWEKSNDAYSLSISVETTINHFSIFTFFGLLLQYQRPRKCFVFSERELTKALRDTLPRAAWLRSSNFLWTAVIFWWPFLIGSFWACACRLSWTPGLS